MKLEFLIQNEEVNLNKITENEILNGCLKAYFFVSNFKETGFEILEEHIIDTKVMITMVIGINKKNTTKALLENMLEYTEDVYYYDNNNEIEFESNILIFENSKVANIYIISGDMSESNLIKNKLVITKLTFDLKDADDKKEYKLKVSELLKIKNNDFKVLNKNIIKDLIDDKIIFSNKQYQHNVKSISEFLGKKEDKKEDIKKEEIKEDLYIELPKVELNKIEFDFDIDDAINEEVLEAQKISENSKKEREIIKEKLKEEVLKENKTIKENNESNENSEDNETEESFEMDIKEAINLDELLFTKSDVKLEILEDKRNKESNNKENNEIKEENIEETISKKIDLNSITNYIYELTSKKINEKDTDMLKIPNYIKTLLPKFFEFDKTNKTVIDTVEYKSRDLNLEIIDAKNNKVYTDNNAKLMQKKSQTYFTFKSDIFKEIPFDENDIVRINKISESEYKIEIISKDLQEYKLWSKMTTMNFKNSDKKYGVM